MTRALGRPAFNPAPRFKGISRCPAFSARSCRDSIARAFRVMFGRSEPYPLWVHFTITAMFTAAPLMVLVVATRIP
ncbi:hypothetical protein JOF56_001767 [Kibdelosporangium banguiense]|uniref:Uncharacterized protein n=1 Tax=Kibdelosporangium banguiense TaxID=1365924 RepID=A0ABS4TAC7_9PSEU|nr:hypothetical protein [Kibdelosporangium banguiense]